MGPVLKAGVGGGVKAVGRGNGFVAHQPGQLLARGEQLQPVCHRALIGQRASAGHGDEAFGAAMAGAVPGGQFREEPRLAGAGRAGDGNQQAGGGGGGGHGAPQCVADMVWRQGLFATGGSRCISPAGT